MKSATSIETLRTENQLYQGTGGVSEGNRAMDFIPAFINKETGQTFISRFANGDPAPIHILDGLPEQLIAERNDNGQAVITKPSVECGFIRQGQFYTRSQAAELCLVQ